MSILCGTDIIEIERVKESVESIGQAFRDRIFTQNEVEYCEARKASKYESYAARFAAKEAVAKALGKGMGEIGWTDVEVLNTQCGKPYVRLKGSAKETFDVIGGRSVDISLSHCKEYAIANVVIEIQ